ncbi:MULTISPECIES: SufE family protein [Frigoribacterium]|uniref:SufE family protein n=1 Tax=Frigoribacterium TaxID=96492 RepID=UPI000F46C172|nr:MULTISPECIES: SufE family protein [Frigoribacterium]MBD8485565.1 SufE family protein [Frigoribacterium sp. CFBP 8759]NQW86034.1 SufE family protein [Frigoribacterium sp. VKM Ac-2860]NQX07366.1 SufE family protein [Frigoribacterium sp. VKM Ac-2859]MBD8140125.1 SufE family protein [Frigoribacterium sp. CFBP 13605]ROS56753.1 cysteine desulfuration protein SufE [Frigoribacterium sp. PhB118]
MTDAALPEALVEIREEFLALDVRNRLQLLLEFSNELPELPARYADHPDLLERVVECQSPVFLFVEVTDGRVHLHATAPREAPTTRGFASILAQGLDGLTVEQVLDDVPDDYPQTIGLTEAVSPLRIRGMTALLGRAKRQIRERTAVA